MASTQPTMPVMHCREKDFNGVNNLAQKILSKGLYAYPEIFDHPPISKVDFGTDLSIFSNLIVITKGNSDNKKLRDKQCKIVFQYLKDLLEFVKPICNGDIDTIIKSGFDSNRQPEKHPVPRQPVIKRVVAGPKEGTYKIYVLHNINKPEVEQDPATHEKNIKYCAELTTTPDIVSSWMVVIPSATINNLVFTKYTPLVKNYVRIYGMNAAGSGQKSEPYMFLPA